METKGLAEQWFQKVWLLLLRCLVSFKEAAVPLGGSFEAKGLVKR